MASKKVVRRHMHGPPWPDCEERMPICRAACCILFQGPITGRYKHCTYLGNNSRCEVYEGRPATCRIYSCAYDWRIWDDYEAKKLVPGLDKLLEELWKNAGSGKDSE